MPFSTHCDDDQPEDQQRDDDADDDKLEQDVLALSLAEPPGLVKISLRLIIAGHGANSWSARLYGLWPVTRSLRQMLLAVGRQHLSDRMS